MPFTTFAALPPGTSSARSIPRVPTAASMRATSSFEMATQPPGRYPRSSRVCGDTGSTTSITASPTPSAWVGGERQLQPVDGDSVVRLGRTAAEGGGGGGEGEEEPTATLPGGPE